ncbi:5-(carboxyamino)imidazole ribonucleotide synthase [Halanaerobacter jeridensis]|uniref:N5-carboxyaminoimidazole ribonucleotide synthase n=1 Tax=Halanaerobacter jeridensis TaxID=706427 RepID=A0A938XTS1_9FIRM|nr:5-(carboxyamino)imidazole ribonucleotide synthase [Halanaerobacter jeridensis]MBM7557596.1 5-(carboxyamino)imidazole ribonucleotide synthase [Halanaerobacter jeridensis]
MNPLKQKIGIIGGGQLGKMMILEAKKMDFQITILDPTEHCPAHSIADEHIVADFDDRQALEQLAQKTDVLTYEFEHIGVDILKDLEAEGYSIYPTPKSLDIIQNKYNQKELLKKNALPVPEYIKVEEKKDIYTAVEQFGYPIMLKSCTGGYDGKGNSLIESESDIKDSFAELGAGKNLLMAEKFVPFTKEISVIVCRGREGESITYPIGENNHEESVLIETKVPADISTAVEETALEYGHQISDVFSAVGIFCIEMFITEDERVLINEIAPRPHNSGHYSIEGCITSQFENHIRAIAGLPLGNTDLVQAAVMRNILGTAPQGEAQVLGSEEVLSVDNVRLHVYGKKIARPGRKMGHLTATDKDLKRAAAKAKQAREAIEIVGEKQ